MSKAGYPPPLHAHTPTHAHAQAAADAAKLKAAQAERYLAGKQRVLVLVQGNYSAATAATTEGAANLAALNRQMAQLKAQQDRLAKQLTAAKAKRVAAERTLVRVGWAPGH